MSRNQRRISVFVASVLALVQLLEAAEHHGVVRFGGLPVPGASVTATQNEKTFSTITDLQGAYSFADLPDGTWTIQVEMQLFEPQRRTVSVPVDATEWELKLLPEDRLRTLATQAPAAPAVPSTTVRPKAPFQRTDLNAASGAAPAVAPATPDS